MPFRPEQSALRASAGSRRLRRIESPRFTRFSVFHWKGCKQLVPYNGRSAADRRIGLTVCFELGQDFFHLPGG